MGYIENQQIPPWVTKAEALIGQREIAGLKHNPVIVNMFAALRLPIHDDETAWCGAFTASCLLACNIAPPKGFAAVRALAYQDWGISLLLPHYGCIGVKKRAGGGHVTFIVGRTASGKLVGLGGNQNNRVCYALYDERDFVSFRWPKDWPVCNKALPLFTETLSMVQSATEA